MTPHRKLQLLILRDSAYFIAIASCFVLPDPIGTILLVVTVFLVSKYIQKPIKESGTQLQTNQKRAYFGITCCYFLLLISALLFWTLHHPSPIKWCIGGLSLTVLLTILYSSFSDIYENRT